MFFRVALKREKHEKKMGGYGLNVPTHTHIHCLVTNVDHIRLDH